MAKKTQLLEPKTLTLTPRFPSLLITMSQTATKTSFRGFQVSNKHEVVPTIWRYLCLLWIGAIRSWGRGVRMRGRGGRRWCENLLKGSAWHGVHTSKKCAKGISRLISFVSSLGKMEWGSASRIHKKTSPLRETLAGVRPRSHGWQIIVPRCSPNPIEWQ